MPAGIMLAIAALVALYGGYAAMIPSTAAVDQDRIVAVTGLLHLDDGDAIVEILVVVHPGEDAGTRARDALHDLYPDAVEVDEDVANGGSGDVRSQQFSANGLVWDTLPVTVSYNSAGAPVGGDLAALLAPLQTWTDVSTSSFAFVYGGATTRCPSLYDGCPGPQVFDGFNDFGWDDIPSAGVLGVTWYSTSIDEMDIVIDNANFVWHTGALPVPPGLFDLETVNLHELGHGAGLGHSGDLAAVMYPSVGAGQAKRVLPQDDIDGISSLYPGVAPTPTATPPPPTATPTPTPTGPLPGDTDGDGCTSSQELGPDKTLGGQRNPANFWDFLDVWTGLPLVRDRAVTISDVGAVVGRFGSFREPAPTEADALAEALTPPPAAPAYHTAFDRGGPMPDEDLWNLLPPDGTINIVDIGSAVAQFGHSCQ